MPLQPATLPNGSCTGLWFYPQTSETKTLPQTSMEISLKRKENNQTFFKKKRNPCFEIFGFFSLPFQQQQQKKKKKKPGLIGSIMCHSCGHSDKAFFLTTT
jgi:hypothetical protein